MSDVSICNDLITEHIDIWTSTVKTKSASGRGSSKKIDLYGIKKLRELILELAVRGKLVPQDPSDEPASKLLERIAAEKAQLVKEKKITKPKALPEISEEEKPFELPEGWEWSRLGSLSSDIHYGYTASAQNDSNGTRLLRITDIQNDKVNWCTVPSCEISIEKEQSYLLENDDILIARTGGTIGKSYLVENIHLKAVFASYLIRVRKISVIYAAYTKVYLGSQLYWTQLFENSAGTGQPNVNATALKSLVFPIPPTSEQHRIVAKVDELMALCDQLEQQTESQIEAQQTLVSVLLETLTSSKNHDELMQNWQRLSEHFDTLFTTEQSIDQLKQTILQLAVMGRLVPQDPTDEPASKLLECIAAEKAQLIADKKIKKQKALPPISGDEKPFELPDGWEWSRLGSLASDIHYGYTASAQNDSNGTRLLRITDIQNDKVNWCTVPSCEISIEKEQSYLLENDDILIARTGGTIGKSYLVENIHLKAVFASYLIRVRKISVIYAAYTKVYLGSQLYWAQLFENSAGTGQPNVNATALKSLVFPIPPTSEQHRIVAKVDELMAICDELKSKLNQAGQTQLHLTDAIVEQVV